MTPTELSSLDTGSWFAQDPGANKAGGKSSALRNEDLAIPEVVLTSTDSPLRVPFPPSAYNDDKAVRVNMI